MPVKIRLQRHGRKRYAYYHIVIADSRAPRDGRNIERIGSYNPNTNPATIDLDFDKALDWLIKGAQPTDTVRAILSYRGVLYKKHLLGGVEKGAFSEEEANRKFEVWMADKEAKIQAKRDGLKAASDASLEEKMKLEAKISEERAAAIAKKNSELAAEVEKASAEEEVSSEVEEVTDEAVVEEPVAEEPVVEESKEEVVEEKAEEPVVEESKEEVVEEKAEEPVVEEVVEEATEEPVKEEVVAEEAKEEKAEETPADESEEAKS